MPHRHSAPTRALPAKPSLAQLRKQAKELLKSYRAGRPAAVAEVERFEQDPDAATFALADAQRVLARAYGFSSWTKLKNRIDVLSNVDAFSQAVQAGDVALVRKLVEVRPALVHEWSGDSTAASALRFAVIHRDPEMTRALMQLGADAYEGIWPHRAATMAWNIATDRGFHDILTIISQEQRRRREKSNSPGASVDSRTGAIQAAIRERRNDDAIKIMESDLSLVVASNVDGATPLHAAAWMHNSEMVAWLLDHEAPCDAQDAKGKTPLDDAAIVAGWSASDYFSHSVLHCHTVGHAIVAGWSASDYFRPFLENAHVEPAHFHETVRLLRAKGAELTPRAAVAIGDKQAVTQMYREGGLKNDVHFCRGGLLAIAVRVNRLDMVSLLLDLGLDPDESATSDDGGRSWGMPLWFASLCGRHEIAELLLLRGADVNAIVHACGDPLGNAHETGDEKMKALLLAHGARITVERIGLRGDRESAKAILNGTLSAESLNVREPTRADLAEQMLWAASDNDPEIVRMCLPHIQRKTDDSWWNRVLMRALPGSCKLILEHGVDPDVAADDGYTTLHHLATSAFAGHDRIGLATTLLDAGASLSRRDPLLKSTPLGWACRWGRIDLVQLYLARGADCEEAGAEPWATPVAWATKIGHHAITELLRSHGAN
jgi:ankyrin repeat protein